MTVKQPATALPARGRTGARVLAGLMCACALAPVPDATGDAPAPAVAPASCSPALEEASSALARGRLDDAERGFREVAADVDAPALARALALFGQARVSIERGEGAGALRTLGRLAADDGLARAHRDMALRLVGEISRRQKGLPGRDPAAYRAALPSLGRPGAVFHVSARGEARGDGSAARPFGSLEQARDAIRGLMRGAGGRLPAGGVRVVVHGGRYAVTGTLELAGEDSGARGSPIVYQAKPGEVPVLTGGAPIRRWGPVSDPAVRAVLDPSVRGRVVEADLTAQGVRDWGDATALRASPELFCAGAPQPLARWPKTGFMTTGETLGAKPLLQDGVVIGCLDGRFRYADDRPSRWSGEPDVRLFGYWYWDWYDEFAKVASIDPQAKVITLAPPYGAYGYRAGQRYRAVNVLREIGEPGEWYLDRRAGRLYWLPPAGVDPNRAPVELSVFAGPFISIDHAADVVLLGLVLEEGRGDAIHIRGGADCLVAGCTVRRFGGDAVVIDGGAGHGVFGCLIHTMGCGGIRATGGDRQTLAPGRLFVEDCTVSDISRLKRTYTPAVLLDGCGNRIAHNLFERMPSSAMRIEGNDQLVELNRVARVVQESDDQGGADLWGNPLYRGNVFRWNRWSDNVGGTRIGAAAVRLDDMISGVSVYGNVFERCGAGLFGAVQVHGGQGNLVDGNLFLSCHAGISFTPWGAKRWLDAVRPFLAQAGAPPFRAHYPELAHIEEGVDTNFSCRNVFAGCAAAYLWDQGNNRIALDAQTDRAIAPETVSDEAAIRGDPLLRRLMVDPIPVGEMGPYEHPWRVVPEREVN